MNLATVGRIRRQFKRHFYYWKGDLKMARRGENIYKRKDGRWEGRITKSDGKYQYLYGKTYKEVKEKMRIFLEEKKYYKAPKTDGIKNSAGLFQNWLDKDVYPRVKPSTYESYYYCIHKYVIPFFNRAGNERLSQSTVACFVQFIKCDITLAASSKKKIFSIFKIALKEILKDDPQYLSLMELVKLPKTQNKEVQVFSMKEQRIIEQTALKLDDKPALGILLCFYTGIRLGELCALKWSDIDMEAGTMSIARTVSRITDFESRQNRSKLLIGTPKSHKSIRKIPLPKFLLNLIGEIKRNTGDQNCYVFSGKKEPLDPRYCQKVYKKILKATQLPDRKFHAIRHTFATRALELGVDIKTLSEILGHSNVAITLNIYAHSLMEQKKAAIDRFNNMYTASSAAL